ncbi:DNA topoisomerase IB [Vacuolonema iberomarrocanum]|uniref:DNA topoisomerase IB n=1 Tax=Vacuolonema iberomarrocanum TaxID=3454632 RepID=UPI0019E0621A|nr:DNA topoisomerase IB [filamentous cyanobacterium LEGE 07170]
MVQTPSPSSALLPSPHSVPSAAPEEPDKSARAAGLRYVSDEQPGIRRQRWGRGFSYFDLEGDRIQEPTELKRLKALPIPPSWNDVWICPFPNGHLLATGRDAKGRKQYRYHPEWRNIRNQNKFDRLIPFGFVRPKIREATDQHMRMHSLCQEKLLAVVVRLLEATLIRVGNDEYAQQNQSFGLTTLRSHHIELRRTKVRFQFTGKSGVEHDIELSDRRLAHAIKRCQELPGQELFQYVDDAGEVRGISSTDVNDYLQAITGEAFTSKDFRTWAGTAYTAQVLEELGEAQSSNQAQENIREAIQGAAKHLGNRVATCRNYYIHPSIPQAYEEGWLLEIWKAAKQPTKHPESLALTPDEKALLTVLNHST